MLRRNATQALETKSNAMPPASHFYSFTPIRLLHGLVFYSPAVHSITVLTEDCFNSSRQGFGRGNNKNNNTGNNNNNAPKMNIGAPAQSPVAQSPQVSPHPNSPSLGSPLPMDSPAAYDPDAPKYFFQEKYAPLNVRGNFLTLCACPKNVELGEWLSHQSKQSLCDLAGVCMPDERG